MTHRRNRSVGVSTSTLPMHPTRMATANAIAVRPHRRCGVRPVRARRGERGRANMTPARRTRRAVAPPATGLAGSPRRRGRRCRLPRRRLQRDRQQECQRVGLPVRGEQCGECRQRGQAAPGRETTGRAAPPSAPPEPVEDQCGQVPRGQGRHAERWCVVDARRAAVRTGREERRATQRAEHDDRDEDPEQQPTTASDGRSSAARTGQNT